MKLGEYEIWWSSLPVREKERIARKAQTKANQGGEVDESKVIYPACSAWWESLDEARKAAIHAHCSVKHGDVLKEWDNANPYGD